MSISPQPAWLKDAIIYEIYPQSFKDSNGDGIGDLPGIIEKLDYIKSLGCDVVWLNPCFDSPFGDAGYDVRDFRKVASRYGTNSDLVHLFKAAHAKGMRVILDFVAGHTSLEHPWFQASARPEKNKFTNWYVWTDNIWSDAGPGMRTVQGYSDRDGSYAANFFHFQPALNYGFAKPVKPWQLPVSHPDVKALRREIIKTMRYWLDLGVDGYRVDMAASLVKNDPGSRETKKFWHEVRRIFDRDYPECALVAEWSIPAQAIDAGFHIDFMIHCGTPAYTALFRKEASRDIFSSAADGHSFFDRKGKGNINEFLSIYLDHRRKTSKKGYISLPTGNHDIGRISTGRTVEELKVVQAFLLTMPGVPCLYYGDEIGMRYVPGISSKEGGYGRTGSRTPMQWDKTRNAGFSIARKQKLYLPVDPQGDRPTVAAQNANSDSLLNHWRKLARLRRQEPALTASADFQPLFARKGLYPFVFLRRSKSERILVAINPSAHAAQANFPAKGSWELIAKLGRPGMKSRKGILSLRLPKFSYAIYRKPT
jgi:maltose alpha-D-glucosyltransferase/alpha-amylase